MLRSVFQLVFFFQLFGAKNSVQFLAISAAFYVIEMIGWQRIQSGGQEKLGPRQRKPLEEAGQEHGAWVHRPRFSGRRQQAFQAINNNFRCLKQKATWKLFLVLVATAHDSILQMGNGEWGNGRGVVQTQVYISQEPAKSLCCLSLQLIWTI